MYEPFFTTHPEGTGLGLWIVKAILDRLGVALQVRVYPQVSTTFDVLLPREW
jgi:C4-dicarboxylate-specific signal transduction histidine kinase